MSMDAPAPVRSTADDSDGIEERSLGCPAARSPWSDAAQLRQRDRLVEMVHERQQIT
jgi:hypothetical protein